VKRDSLRYLTAALLLATAGCSFVAVRPLPDQDLGTSKQECASGGWVAADLAGSAVAAYGGAWLNAADRAVAGERCGRAGADQSGCPGGSIASFIPAFIFGAAALYGAIALGHCHQALPPDTRGIPSAQ
jgi:hypothetical protein